MSSILSINEPVYALYTTILPGPDRKRHASLYSYRMTYHNSENEGPSCVTSWAVSGGREIYKIDLERDQQGRFRWHCTCADAVYRGETEGKICKHVRGLWLFGLPYTHSELDRTYEIRPLTVRAMAG